MFNKTAAGLMLFLMLTGCATYQTPGAGVNVGDLSRTDADIAEVMKREPAALFPARLAIARIETTGYVTTHAQCYGSGRYCVATTHELETDQDLQRIEQLPMVAGIATVNRMLVPEKLDSVKDLRLGAASLKADFVLVYSIDTRFNVESTDIGPLALISLGFLPNKKAHVTATASAALFDVRTGFVYGVAESSATEQQRATVWSSDAAIDSSRLQAETEAFHGMLDQFVILWQGVVKQYAGQKS
jgi:hypothetical protein